MYAVTNAEGKYYWNWWVSSENWVWLQGESFQGEILTLWTISPSSRGWRGLMALSLGSLYQLILQHTKESLPLLKRNSCCDEWKHGGKEWGLVYGLHSFTLERSLASEASFHSAPQWSLDQQNHLAIVTVWPEDGKELNVHFGWGLEQDE